MAKLYRNKCLMCGIDYRGRGRQHCSRTCSQRTIAAKLGRWNTANNPERLRTNHPMWTPGVKERMMATRRLSKESWRPPVNTIGGNGRPRTAPQLALAGALGWPMEVAVATRGKALGFPNSYKVDIANDAVKLAVEVDGPNHNWVKYRVLDTKKERCLAGLGWTVLRFSNRRVMEHLEECVAEVLSTTSKLKARTSTSLTAS